jgi:hypothetical protein
MACILSMPIHHSLNEAPLSFGMEERRTHLRPCEREFVRLGGMEFVPVRMQTPQVLKAAWIWDIVVRHSGDEKELEVKRGVASITGSSLILAYGHCG